MPAEPDEIEIIVDNIAEEVVSEAQALGIATSELLSRVTTEVEARVE